MMFEELTTQEIALVSGGDRWAGTPEGRMPCLYSAAMSVPLPGGTGAAGAAGAVGAASGAPGLAPLAGPSLPSKVAFMSR
ncbi:hypothetical protein [Roseateles sp. L2-2]|uniref:hypothetical protein n=1 Tax=Roseateles sp. L2-2 TaxID=3422597 RepID=UPI003D3673D4